MPFAQSQNKPVADGPKPERPAKERIAVLGAGISSLSAVYELTSAPDWDQKYEITVYQMGWRIGGKGASSRNPKYSNRIEEHGLHIWLGFYENAFELIRDCYSHLPQGSKCFPTWQDAFKPHNFVVLEEHIRGNWIHWHTTFPSNDSLPGDGRTLPTLWDYVLMSLDWLTESFSNSQPLAAHITTHHHEFRGRSTTAVNRFLSSGERSEMSHGMALLTAAHRKAHRLPRNHNFHTLEDHKTLWALLCDLTGWLKMEIIDELDEHTELRRIFIPIDILCSVLRGFFADNILWAGLDSIDSMDFRTWLAKHGATKISLESAWLRGAYDLAFSFENGDKSKPNLAAGVAVRCGLRMVFTYKGSVLWKMQAGMGETVFTPLYVVLKNRGVKFAFFHKVETLRVSSDGKAIDAIDIRLQATVRNGSYEPLIPVGDLWCWQHQPDCDQLEEGEQLRAQAINLESHWTPWPGVGAISLKYKTDFDTILLGIPVAALTSICSELADASSAWAMMLSGIKTIQTQGFQLWLNKNLSDCGWDLPSPILGAYKEPVDTWADMTHLLKVEGWNPQTAPSQVAYFCGVLKDDAVIPPPSDYSFPTKQSDEMAIEAIRYIESAVAYLWPNATTNGSKKFDWNTLHSEKPSQDEQRFYSQYWRANIDPSERYTLATAGTTSYRMKVSESGFLNLVLTGDWVRNGLNSPGCIESSVISGRQAARHILGGNGSIVGETDFSTTNRIISAIVKCISALFFSIWH